MIPIAISIPMPLLPSRVVVFPFDGSLPGHGEKCWGVMKGGLRPLSSIPAVVMAAERKLVSTDEGWRFVPQDRVPEGAECLKLDFIPVEVQVDDDAHTSWKIVKESNILLFDREPDQGLYNKAMGEGVNGLLRDIPLEDSPQIISE